MEDKLNRRKSKMPIKYSSYFVYRLDLDTTGMMLSTDKTLVHEVTQYLVDRVAKLAKKFGYKNYVVIPGYGKRDVALIEGTVY